VEMKKRKSLFTRIKFFKYQIRTKILFGDCFKRYKRENIDRKVLKSFYSFFFPHNLYIHRIEKTPLFDIKRIPFGILRAFQLLQSLQVFKVNRKVSFPLIFFDTISFLSVKPFFGIFSNTMQKFTGFENNGKGKNENFFQNIPIKLRKEILSSRNILTLEKTIKKIISSTSFFSHIKILSRKNAFLEFNFLNCPFTYQKKFAFQKRVEKSLFRNFIAFFDFINDF